MITPFIPPKNPQKITAGIKDEFEAKLIKDSYLRVDEVVSTIKEKLERPHFNLDSLVLLTRTEELGIYAGVTSIISFIVPSDDPENANDLNDLDAVTPLIVKAAKWYDIKELILKGFEYHNNGVIAALQSFEEDNCEWLISKKELEHYIKCEKMPAYKHWKSIASGQSKVGKFWYFVVKNWCDSQIKLIPPYSEILNWLDDEEKYDIVQKNPIEEIDPINETIKIKGLSATNAKTSWNRLRTKIEKTILENN